ncbi:acetolactate decarboxylase [Streptomyces sp. NPDC059743]|uniref:acetolactate decarboxylase n=1 Tax=Streptomyces sp. NPDC059743 TaxID=3346928 RepID=UPI0036477E1F
MTTSDQHDQHTPTDRFRRWARTMIAHRLGDPADRHRAGPAHEIYQSSTMGALLDGVYEGDVTIAELLTHGDFGLGTFNRLDGEMVVLDGICYHLWSDGSAAPAEPMDRTPFAVVTRFEPQGNIRVTKPMGRAEVIALIDKVIPSANLVHAVRITGTFGSVRTRTVMKQTPPYPSLVQATEGQAETTFTDTAGTLAGFRSPDYEQGISVAGYHLHFLDAHRGSGGHALDFRLDDGDIDISTASEFHLSLPRSGKFLNADLSTDRMAEQIRRTEGG